MNDVSAASYEKLASSSPAGSSPPNQAHLLKAAFEIARKSPHLNGITVGFKSHIPELPGDKRRDIESFSYINPEYNLLLCICDVGVKQNIDIISLKGLNGNLKSAEALGKEIVAKVHQHQMVVAHPGYLTSSSGSKYDVRKLKQHRIEFQQQDNETYVAIDGRRIVLQLKDGFYYPLPASQIHSYTVLRAREDGDIVYLEDEYQDVRTDGLDTVAVNTKKPLTLQTDQISKTMQKQAETFHRQGGQYLMLYRKKEEIPKG